MPRFASLLWSFGVAAAFAAAPSSAAPIVVTGNVADFERNEDGSAGSSAATALLTGANTTLGGGRNAVYVFDLSGFAASGDTLTSADFQMTLLTKSGTPAFNADLYAVGYSTSAATPPAGADYYEGTFNQDNTNSSSLFALQDNIVTPATATGAAVATNAAADTQLVTFINARPVGSNFVWLRVSPDADAGTSLVGYNFGSADNATASARPQLGLNTQVPEPACLSAVAVAAFGLLARRKRDGR